MKLRWEWRAFGDALGEAGVRLAEVQPDHIAESDETYLLSSGSDDAVKSRAGLMDVKRLEEVGENGLELWRPISKAPLPVSADQVRAVLDALRVPVPPLERASYDLADIAGMSAEVTALRVHKTRRHLTFGGCRAELTDIRASAGATRTVAIESEHPARVVAAVHELRLDPHANVSVPRGLKALLSSAARAETHA